MCEPIAGPSEGVIGFEAVGEVEASDYEEVLMPAIADHCGETLSTYG